MLFAKPFGVRFHQRLAMSTLVAASCVGASANSIGITPITPHLRFAQRGIPSHSKSINSAGK